MKNYIILILAIVATTMPVRAQQPVIDAEGGIRVGNTSDTTEGTIRYNNNNFEGFANGVWHSLNSPESLWSKNGNVAFYDAGSVGIGTSNPGLVGGASKYLTIDHGGVYSPLSSISLELKGNVNAANTMFSRIDFINGLTPTTISRISARTHGNTVLQGHLVFETNDGSLKERMRITDIGNIGIATESPTSALTLSDTNRNALTLHTSNNNLNNGIAFQNSGLSYTWNIFRSDAGSSQANLIFAGGVTNAELVDLPQRMILYKNGNVGIGALVPRAKFHIANNSSETETANQIRLYDGGGDGSTFGMGISNSDFDFFSHRNYRWHTRSTHVNRGVEVFTILENGRVGIGMPEPVSKLSILDTKRNSLTIKTNDNSKHGGIAFQNSGNAYVWNMYRRDAGNNYADLVFAGGPNEEALSALPVRFMIKSNGYVGVGNITSPTSLFHVNEGDLRVSNPGNSSGQILLSESDADPAIQLYSNEPELYRADIIRTSTGLSFNVSSNVSPTSRMTVLNNGYVGVGTAAPEAMFHIQTGLLNPDEMAFRVGGRGDVSIDGIGVVGGRMIVKEDGKVGINTPNPAVPLHAKGLIRSSYTTNLNEFVEIGHGGSNGFINTQGDGNLQFRHDGINLVQLKPDGKLFIGNVATPGDYKLYVEKGILTEEVKVAIKGTSDWADDAFDRTPDLSEVEMSIDQSSHLVDMPSAKELVDKGYSVTDMDARLLQQIEWLWMHMIEQERENEELKLRIEKLEQILKQQTTDE